MLRDARGCRYIVVPHAQCKCTTYLAAIDGIDADDRLPTRSAWLPQASALLRATRTPIAAATGHDNSDILPARAVFAVRSPHATASADPEHALRPITVDIHAHYFPADYLRLMKDEGARHGVRYDESNPHGPVLHVEGDIPSGPVNAGFVDLDVRLAAMNEQQVDVQALSLTQPMVYFDDAEFSLALARTFNDAASAAHVAHPRRLVGLAQLPLDHPRHALDELERAARLPGIRGVYFGTNTGRLELSANELFPVYERVASLGLPIFLHPVKQVGFARLQPYFLRNLLGNPMENALAAAHLIFGGVLDAFPTLEVSLPHAGGALPWISGRLDQGHRVNRQCGHLPRPPSDYLRRFTYDTICHSEEIMAWLITLVGADRIMLGSDYCFAMGYRRPKAMVDALDVSDEDRNLILGGTAARLLRIA
jgi:aminocarboxymuconate-semialdehyde decarboxylase